MGDSSADFHEFLTIRTIPNSREMGPGNRRAGIMVTSCTSMSAHEKIFPAPDILNEVEYGKFVLTNLAAKRAKQIKEGAPPLVRIDTSHPLSIALAEIAAGKIKPILGSDAQAAELEEDYSALDELGLDDVGLLLPGVDDDELDDDLLGLGAFGEEDEEETDEEDVIEGSLADILGEGDEEEVEAAPAGDDTEMSLDDLAEEEEAAAEESSDDI